MQLNTGGRENKTATDMPVKFVGGYIKYDKIDVIDISRLGKFPPRNR